eukprot:328943-Amphidinium_carterae.2
MRPGVPTSLLLLPQVEPRGAAAVAAAAAAAAESRVLGNQHTTGGSLGSTGDPGTGEFGQPTPRQVWPIFQKCNREPD